MFSFRPFQLIPAPLIRPCGWGSKVFPGIAALVLIANPACSEESSPQDPPRQTYLSDTDRTACYLETIQKPNFLGKQTWQSDLDKKKISDLKNELVRRGFNPDEIDRLLRDGLTTAVSTRFENPLAIKILQKLVEEVETALPKVDLTSPGKVLYGSMSTKSVNAEVVDVPPGWTCHKPEAASSIFASRILLVNTSALTYAHETTKVLISTIPIEEKNGGIALKLGSDELTRQLQESSEAKDAFVENFLEFEQIAAKTPFFIDKKYTAFLSPMRDAIELFVVAHEYSHIALNHKRETPNSPFSWKQELEADYYGFNVMGAAIFQNPKHPKEFRLMQLLSPMLFLRTQELLENSKQVYYTGSVPDLSESERKKIMDFLTEAFGEVDNPVSQAAQHSAQPPGDHPPLWARGVFMQLLTGTLMEKYKGSAIERQFAELTFALIRNADRLYEETAPKLPLLNQALQKKEQQQ